MILLRTNLFSKKKLLSAKTLGGILAIGGLGLNIGANMSMKHEKDIPKFQKENQKLLKELKKRAEKDNIYVDDSPKGKKKGGNYFVEISEKDKRKYGKYKGRVRLSSGSASTLSHELGHGEYILDISKDTDGKVGRFMHKAAIPSRIMDHPILKIPEGVLIGMNGVSSGHITKKRELEGKKNNIFNKHRAWALPALIDAPKVISEGMASAKGYRMLKDAGASKEYLKHTRRNLTKAGLTYLGGAMVNAGLGLVGKGAGEENAEFEAGWNRRREENTKDFDLWRSQMKRDFEEMRRKQRQWGQ